MWKLVTRLFKRTTPEQRLLKEYDRLIQRAHDVSHRDRRASDLLRGQAEDIWTEIETLRFNQSFENDNQ
jgi:hypothetical protein